jgi:rhamnose utilization protein RhaD (predicted bifunctional aldolase and dehydrogenase)
VTDKPNDILAQLIDLSMHLGDPANDYAILGEGNTSAKIDSDRFWVKASGSELRTIDENGFVEVYYKNCLSVLESEYLSDDQIKNILQSARVDPGTQRIPSVETFLHALALQLEGVQFVGHTHPVAVNAIMCSKFADYAISGRLFPDEIVVCGPAPVYVPYTDPGLPLAKATRRAIQIYLDTYGETPKVVLMQNHGFIALGKTPSEVERIHAMYVKTAKVLLGTYSLGGPNFLTPAQVERIHKRPDEHYRRAILSKK